jgi:hypothetical protein
VSTRKARWCWLSALLLSGSAAQADEAQWGLKASALAGKPAAAASAVSSRASIEPKLQWKGQTLELRARARVRWLAFDSDHRVDTDVRELTLSTRSGDTALTIGAQQLNWGRMDILRVADIVNPVDQHDLFFEELPEAKLALWMANLEWQSGTQTLQLVATPQVPTDRFADRVNELPVHLSKPRTSFRNATTAVRYGFEANGWNVDVMALRGWQAAVPLRPIADVSGARLAGALSRQDSIGFSADKPIGGTVLRLEGLVARLKPTYAASILSLGVRRQASLGAGLDVRLGPWFVAGQTIVQHDRDTTTGSGNNAFASLIVQRKWLQDRLAVRGLHMHESRSGSSWSSLQAAFELSPQYMLQLQGDLFNGKLAQGFGYYRERSRIAASMRFQF